MHRHVPPKDCFLLISLPGALRKPTSRRASLILLVLLETWGSVQPYRADGIEERGAFGDVKEPKGKVEQGAAVTIPAEPCSA